MKALILAAGLGTRLRPLTDRVPKQMVEIGGKPLLWHNLRQLATGGVEEIWINLHHLPEVIRRYVGDGRRWGVKVYYSFEPELLGTAGALRNPQSRIERSLKESEPFAVLYGDSFNNFDYGKMVDFYREKRATMVLNLHESFAPWSAGVVVTDENGRVAKMVEKPLRENLPLGKSFSGVCLCGRRVWDYIPLGGFSDFGKQVIPEMVAAGERIYAKDFGFYSQDVGSVEKLEKARDDFAKGVVKFESEA